MTRMLHRRHARHGYSRTPLVLAVALLVLPAAAGAENRAVARIAACGVNQFGQLGSTDGPLGHRVPLAIDESGGDTVPSATAIASGAYHNLAVAADGTVWSWGANHAGQLGDGTLTDRSLPVQVMRRVEVPLTAVIAVAAGYGHSLALLSDGTVWAWGDNQFGQLGDGSTESRRLPVKVEALEFPEVVRQRVIAIAAGAQFSLALRSDGTVWAWGANDVGQLADGSFDQRSTPVRVIRRNGPLDQVKAISAGYAFALALLASGKVWSWGDNSNGQLGSGSPGPAGTTAQPVGRLRNVIAVAAGGSHSLALLAGGTVRAWGSNAWGQLGDDTTDNSPHPTTVQYAPSSLYALDRVTAIAAGGFHSLALLADGTVRAWGDNSAGQLGDGTNDGRLAPAVVVPIGVLDVRAIAAGRDHSVQLFGDLGNAFRWGGHLSAVVADPSPVQVTYEPNAALLDAAVDGGLSHSLLLTAAGHVFAWGENHDGQLGDGTHNPRATPGIVGGLDHIKMIDAGIRHNLAVTVNGTVYAWGQNDKSQLGDGTSEERPLPVPVKKPPNSGGAPLQRVFGDVIAVAGGWGHSLALRADGSVWAWGINSSGQLGDGSTKASSIPVRVKGPRGRHHNGLVAPYLTGIVAIAAGSDFSLALRVDGTVWAWGANEVGQLGDSTFSDSRYPRAVLSEGQSGVGPLVGVKAIAAGLSHALALGSAGTVRSWGSNLSGALGRGPNAKLFISGTVDGEGMEPLLLHVEAIAAGVGHSLTLKSDGTAWGWGLNANGQVGDGTFEDRGRPVQVMRSDGAPFLHPTVIGAGVSHSLAISWREAVRGRVRQ